AVQDKHPLAVLAERGIPRPAYSQGLKGNRLPFCQIPKLEHKVITTREQDPAAGVKDHLAYRCFQGQRMKEWLTRASIPYTSQIIPTGRGDKAAIRTDRRSQDCGVELQARTCRVTSHDIPYVYEAIPIGREHPGAGRAQSCTMHWLIGNQKLSQA